MAQHEKTMDANWIPGAGLGLIGTIVAWIMGRAKFEARADAMREADDKRFEDIDGGLHEDLSTLRDELKAGVAELRALAMASAKRDGAQDVINKVTTETLTGLADRLDTHDRVHERIDATLTEHAVSLRLLTQLMDRRSKEQGREGSL